MNPCKPLVGDVIIYRCSKGSIQGVVTFIHGDGSLGFEFNYKQYRYVCLSGAKQGPRSDLAKGARGTWRWPSPGEVKFPFFKVTRRRDGKGYIFKPRKRRPAA